MKQVYLIPMSRYEDENEKVINDAIYRIGKDSSVTWLADLIKALDDSKYMLVADKEETTGSETPEIGVRVIRGSQNMLKTEEIINEELKKMDEDNKSFISICHPSEFMYIILFEYKAGTNPRVKIVPNPADAYIGSRKLTDFFERLDEDEYNEINLYLQEKTEYEQAKENDDYSLLQAIIHVYRNNPESWKVE